MPIRSTRGSHRAKKMGRVLKTSMFERAENITINGSTFAGSIVNHAPEVTPEWMRSLQENTVAGAFHNSGERRDPPKCHPGTREVVIQEIMDWVRGSSRTEMQRFLWIYGPAGTGKSSIAQTIAEFCEKEGFLASDFFFSRMVPGQNSSSKLVSTLACQLTVSIPDIKPYMATAITSDSLLFSRSIAVQLEKAILRSFERLISGNRRRRIYPYVIIIDGLDECDTPESQRDILAALSSAVNQSFPIFIVASRPEPAIREMFNGDLNIHTRRIFLDDQYQPDKDIRVYLNSRFSDIRNTHPMAAHLPVDWPSSNDLNSIIQKSSGQFIYASTVMKFIASRRSVPTRALDTIVSLSSGGGNNSPYADLDALYTAIFQSLEGETLQRTLNVFAFIYIASKFGQNPTMRTIEELLKFAPGELFVVLDDLHSIVSVPKELDGTLRFFHASLGDFQRDKSRSLHLFIEEPKYHLKIVLLCIESLSTCLQGASQHPLGFSPAQRFSFQIFMLLFDGAPSSQDLLRKLDPRSFPVPQFIKFVFSASTALRFYYSEVLHHLSYLFEWIKEQDTELYSIYVTYLDDYLKFRMILDPGKPRWEYIFAALTLGDEVRILLNNIMDLSHYLGGDHEFFTHLFSAEFYVPSSVPEVDVTFILERLSRLLTGRHPSAGHRYAAVTSASYVGLAREIFNSLTSPEMERNTDIIFISHLFLAALKKIPGNVEMGKYLCDHQHRKYIDNMKPYATELRSAVDLYINHVNLPGPEAISITEYSPPSITESIPPASVDRVVTENWTPPPSFLPPPTDHLDPKTTEPESSQQTAVAVKVPPEKKKTRGSMGNLLKRVFSFQKSKSQ